MTSPNSIMQRHGFAYPYLREDPHTGLHTAILRFPTGNGKTGTIEVSASLLFQKRNLLPRLQDMDAVLPSDPRQLDELLETIPAVQPKRRQRFAKSCGWSDDHTWFVTGGKIIGNAPEGQLPTRRVAHGEGEPGHLRCRGTTEAWRETVGKHALMSSTAMLTVCAALGAPLLVFTGLTSFLLCLSAPTRAGKSLGSEIGASLIGIGRIEDFISWYSTEVTVEERLPDFRDTLFVIDDISTMNGTPAARYQYVRQFGYALGTNQGKGRSRTYKASTGTTHLRHRTIALTSAESPLSEMAKSARSERQGGEMVRFIDLPATKEGQTDIFDRLQIGNPIVRRKAVRKLIKAILSDCARYHGTAFRAYILKLIPMRAQLREIIESSMNEFVEWVIAPHDGQQAEDIARKFGLLYAAGMLGVRLQIVPWTAEQVRNAITTCYRRARKMLVDDGQLLRSGLQLLRRALEGLPKLPQEKSHPMRFETVNGYRGRKAETDYFVVKVDAFNQMLPNVPQRTIVRNWLLENGYLAVRQIRGRTGTAQSKPREQFPWPDEVRRRSVRINGMPRLPSA